MTDRPTMESVLQLFQKSLDEAIRNALLKTQSSSREHSKFVLRKKAKDLHQGDMTVPSGCLKLDSTQQEKLLLHMTEYCASADTLTRRVSCDKYSLLTFFIDRPRMCGQIVKEVLARGSRYGFCDGQQDRIISLHSLTLKKTSSLMNIRLAVVKFHALKLLEANGYKVIPPAEPCACEFERLVQSYFGDTVSAESAGQLPSSEYASAKNSENISSDGQLILYKLHSLSRKSESDCDFESSPKTAEGAASSIEKDFMIYEGEGNVSIDLQRVICSKNLHQGKGGFDANLKNVQVLQDGQPSEVLEESLRIVDSLPNFPQITKHHCLHVVPHSAAFTDQKIALMLHSLVDCELSQSQMIIGPISVQEASDPALISAQEFYKSRFCQFQEASEMRNAISNNEYNEEDMKILTDASIKIDILGNACGGPLTLENTASGRGAESRLGAFILYNTARLSTLLQRFDQAVTEGFYPPLPPMDLIDWTLLREEEDWELVYVYLAALPELVSQSVECVCPADGKLSARIHTHKVTNFLVSFCKCLSAHYSRYHILTGRESHLLPLMYTRLYMMKAAHQVLLNSLQLIGVKSLSYV